MNTPKCSKDYTKQCYVLLEPITPKVNDNFTAELKKVINEKNMLTTKTRRRVTEALEEIQSETEAGNRRLKKQQILKEIIESEENYIKQLEIIMEFFIKPSMERNLLDQEDFDILFGNLDTIYKINKELLVELKKGASNVARAFSHIAPFFKCYSFYAFEFKHSMEILQNCPKDNPNFEKFLEMQESRPEVQSKLSALLITPIQRIPRYKLLLQPLVNLTSPSDPDYESLLESLTKVENVAEHINKVLKERENMQKLVELNRCLQKPNLITPGRSLIKEGTLKQIASKDGKNQKLYVALMNDLIVFCKFKKDSLKPNSLKCTSIFPLNKCQVHEVLDKGAFRLICQNEEIVLFHKTLEETREWIKEIKTATQTYIEDRKTLRKENTLRRPVKRKFLNEYNEVGLSPGIKLKKKSQIKETAENFHNNRPLTLTKRKSIRSVSNTLNFEPSSPSFFVTLRPPHLRKWQNEVEKASPNDNNTVSQEVFVFGQPQPDKGFSFKLNQWVSGIGSSVKKFFGFR